eukprot:961398_1
MLPVLTLWSLIATHIPQTESYRTCTNQESFVEVQASSPISNIQNETLISTRALFPPHSYYVPWTELVVLKSHDDICNILQPLSSNITNKIVLLFESIGHCGIHRKVLVAQNKGAKAVLIANNDLTGQVHIIHDDGGISGVSTIVPMRSISKNDGELLYDEVQAHHGIEIRFGCPSTPYPSILCLTDPTGEFADFAGNYQRQVESTFNAHPVWRMNGYAKTKEHLYLYLHAPQADSDSYWVASHKNARGDTFSDADIVLKCAEDSSDAVPDPTFCSLWLGSSDDKGKHFNISMPQINVTSDLCPLGGQQQICVDSLRLELAGLRGDYTLHSNGEPIWYRDLTDCDMRAGYLSYIAEGEYGSGYFIIDEPLNEWVIAMCHIPREQSEDGTFATAKWRPDLCKEWVARNDIGLRYTPLPQFYDPTLDVLMEACDASHKHTPECVATAAPDTVCFANNSIIHGALMGEYRRLNETGPSFGSSVYQRIAYDNPIVTNDTDTLYVWYANEFFAHFGYGDFLHRREWIMTPTPLDHAMATGKYQYYGLCQGFAYGNVAKCVGWVFYAGAHHYDEQMTVTEAECTSEPFPVVPDTWPEYICIGLKNASRSYGDVMSALDVYEVLGGYHLNETVPSDSPVVPGYLKPPNDYVSDSYYLWFSDEWGVMNDSTLKIICDPYGKKTVNPVDCGVWYDTDWELMDNIYVYECGADDVLTFSPTSYPTIPTINPTFAPTPSPSISPSLNPSLYPSMVPSTAPSNAPSSTPSAAPICVSRNGSITSSLEGVYAATHTLGSLGTIEFESQNELYMWYHDSKWWISPVNHDEYSDDIDVYGYCEGGVAGMLPSCEGCWMFYWQLSAINSNAPFMEDCLFTLDYGCEVQTDDVYHGLDTYRDTLCLNRMSDADASNYNDEYEEDEQGEDHEYEEDTDDVSSTDIDLRALYGKYELNEFYYERLEEHTMYIWHDKMTNHWLIGDTLFATFALLVCRNSDAVPVECVVWDEKQQTSKHMDHVLSVTEQCIEQHGAKWSKEAVIEMVVVVSLVVCGIAIILLWRRKCKRDKVHQNTGVLETEFVETSHRKTAKKKKDGALVSSDSQEPGAYDMTILDDGGDASQNVTTS